jgi:hypothetical protein
MTMTAHPALVLNADFRPMSYFRLSLLSWQDAVHAVFTERVSVVAEYDVWARSPSTQIRLPSVVALRKYQRSARRVAFTRFISARPLHVPVLRRGLSVFSTDLRARHSSLTRRPDDLVEHRHRLRAVQHGLGQLAARQAAPPAQGTDAHGVVGCQARVSARLSARKLGGLPLLGRTARGLASSRSSVDQSTAVRRWGRAFKSRRDVEHGRFRWSGRQPVLKTGGHRKVWRSNGQPSANRGASDRKVARINPSKYAQILKRQRGLTVGQVPSGSAGSSPALCTSVRSSMAEPCRQCTDMGSIPVDRTNLNSPGKLIW